MLEILDGTEQYNNAGALIGLDGAEVGAVGLEWAEVGAVGLEWAEMGAGVSGKVIVGWSGVLRAT